MIRSKNPLNDPLNDPLKGRNESTDVGELFPLTPF
jgi:hypothetical protein